MGTEIKRKKKKDWLMHLMASMKVREVKKGFYFFKSQMIKDVHERKFWLTKT